MLRPIDRVIQQLTHVTKNGNGWTARCPAHHDAQPSLSIGEGDDGAVLLYCHAGCPTDRVVATMGLTLADLMPQNSPCLSTKPPAKDSNKGFRRRRHSTARAALEAYEQKHGKHSAHWIYTDARSEPLGLVVRWDHAGGKDYRPISKKGEKWVCEGMAIPRPLYQLPTLAGANRVYVCEGEKAADAGIAIGLTCTSPAHGAKSPAKADWGPLAGKDVVILPDNDDAGVEFAEHVAKLLSALSPKPTVKIVNLPGLPDKGDLVEFVESCPGETPEQIRVTVEAMADDAEVVEADGDGDFVEQPPTYTPYPVDVLPRVLRRYVEAVSDSMRTDPACVALSALTACAAAIGTSRAVRLKRRWHEVPMLWSVIVAEQGSGKSPPMREALRPLMERQRREFALHAEKMEQYEGELATYQRDLQKFKGGKVNSPPRKPDPPSCTRHIVSDSTLEALAPVLLENPRGVLLDGDELTQWFGGMDRYAQTQRGDAAAWRRMFDGHAITIDRKTGRQVIHVPRPFVAIVGTIQPGILRRVLGAEHQESGLAARMLLAFPPRSPVVWSDRDIPAVVESDYERLIDDLLGLSPEFDDDKQPRPVAIPMTPDARELFVRWHDDHRGEQVALSGLAAGHWSKLVAIAARFSLILQLVKSVSASGRRDAVEVDAVTAAITLVEWHKREASRVFAMLTESDAQRDRRELLELAQRRGGKITPREVVQYSRNFKTVKDAEAALEELVQVGCGSWDAPSPSTRGGRPTKVFRSNTNPVCVYKTPAHDSANGGFVDTNSINEPENPPSEVDPPGSMFAEPPVTAVPDSDNNNNDREVFTL